MSGGPSGGGGQSFTAQEIAIRLALACVLLLLAQTFTGLNLGLFSLDCGQLQVIIDVPQNNKVGGKAEADARHARRVLPLRRLGNLLLCTILLGNTMVNALMAILLAGLTNGFMGWLLTTIIIVYIGEILPQSVCSRHGLLLGSILSPVIWVAVVLLFPVTKLYALVLDCIFPDEESLMDRSGWRGMVEYVRHANAGSMSLDHEQMLLGSLDLGETRVKEVMVPMADACFLEVDDELNLEKLMWIQQTGFTRLPVYDRKMNRCVGLLHCKDLLRRDLGVDFHRGNTLRAAALLEALERKGQHRELCQIPESMSLLDLLALFKQGKPHLVVVCAKSEYEDEWSEHIGLVTLHNVYQKILERGVLQDVSGAKEMPRQQSPVPSLVRKGAIRLFDQPTGGEEAHSLPEAQMQAIKVLLQQTQPCFGGAHISEVDLEEVLKKTEVITSPKGHMLYRSRERSQTAMVVLRGQIDISAGKEGFISRVGHLAALGMQALEPPVSLLPALRASGSTELLEHHDVHDYIPDFTATVVSNECCVLCIHRQQYLRGYGSTQLQLARASNTAPSPSNGVSSGKQKEPSLGSGVASWRPVSLSHHV